METVMRRERKARKLTQEYVGGMIGITPEAVLFIETGQRKPSYDVMCKLEKLFGMKHEELFAPAADNN